jgi:hypothetical protein
VRIVFPEKVAVIALSDAMEMVQVVADVFAHSDEAPPLQPVKVDPEAAVAVSVTDVASDWNFFDPLAVSLKLSVGEESVPDPAMV